MRYREVLYGVVFGVGACVIDIVMHARMTERSVLEELFQPSAAMLFYRGLFLILGFGIGALLWQKNKREREARRLAELLDKLRHEIAAPVIIIHANAQLLLTQQGTAASPGPESVLQSIYEQSKKLHSLVRD